MDNYGERLKAARKIRGLTQVQLAERLGITQKSYQRMETGVHDLKMSTIYDICKTLEISSDWLIGLNVNNQDNIIEFPQVIIRGAAGAAKSNYLAQMLQNLNGEEKE